MSDSRKDIIQYIIITVGIIFLVKLFFLQIVDSTYKLAADNNVIQRIVDYPYRGLIYDRNDKLIVYNNPVYDLMVVPKEVKLDDTLAFCAQFGVTKDYLKTKLAEAKDYSPVKPSVFLKQLSNQDFARMQDFLIDYPGFYVLARTVRSYSSPTLANALGYIGEISKPQLERDTSNYYSQGDYIGISGLEAKYETSLRGKRGVKYKMVNVRGVEKGSFKGGSLDTISIPGDNLKSTIEYELQNYGEFLFNGKTGSAVAIEPKTGEVLSIISSPSYDPNLLTGREFSRNFNLLQKDSLVPLFNRPIMAMYPPGSIFKTVQALIGLQEGVIKPETRIYCNRSIINCHGAHSNEDLQGAITHSCNPYFLNVFKRIINQDLSKNNFIDSRLGLEKWHSYITKFGFGSSLGIDIPNEKGGYMPTANYYNKIYGENRWAFSTIYSVSIGQGEVMVTPLQMANLMATIANKGYYITPHLIKEIGENGEPLQKYKEKHYTGIEEKHYDVVIRGMEEVVRSGTGSYRAKLKDIVVCGKTGTAQNPHGEDHSVFVAFAPKDDPKIAVAVYVENAGQGARAAASIASLMIEKYLKGTVERKEIEDYVLKGRFVY